MIEFIEPVKLFSYRVTLIEGVPYGNVSFCRPYGQTTLLFV